MRWLRVVMVAMVALANSVISAQHLDTPIVGTVFFYWYEWDEDEEWGNWLGAVHNTPLYGYYDNRKVRDNFHSLLLAADWGLTNFFLDYWGHDWRGENNEPREATVLKAAEKVRALGYPIFIGYYQDGTNFAMRDFWRNVSERRDTYLWLRDYARSPAWTWLFGKPFQMVYARNGVPELTVDHEGFQGWLRQRYGSIEKLNAEWGTNFRNFSEIRMDFKVVGFQRAMSIAYQYERWQQDWAKLEQLIRQELGLPGLKVSLDVGYAPFRGFGFEKFALTFGGPHSYAGIFGQPHEQDAERFLQAAVAKKCGAVFFDHLKHRYFDWNIRVPGTAYPPEPHHFDRFWVGNLMRFVDGVLHLSWNEWWEGSNLEPSMEGGKRFCETNLLYSTIWQLTYRDRGRGAWGEVVGLLVNDWIFEHGGGNANDLYNAVQGLRSVNAPFDIVLQSEATLENLKRFRVLVAPAGGVGFGFNAKNERIDEVLNSWLQLGKRTLITSQGGAKGMEQGAPTKATTPPSPRLASCSFNFFADIGSPGDEIVLVQGFSGREDWGKLPEGAFGAGSKVTVRWTPETGNTTVLLLPALPDKDLLLRWHGSAIWQNRVTVFVNEQHVGEVVIGTGWHVYEVRLPTDIVGKAKVIEVKLQFAEAKVPGEKEPQRFRGEQRVCNLALDWVQICTPDMPVGERKSVKWQPTEAAEFVGGMQKNPYTKRFRAPLQHRRARLLEGKVLSVYADGVFRDFLIAVNSSRAPFPSSLLFVNGIFTEDPRWWATILEQMAKVKCGKFACLDKGSLPDRPDLMSAVLTAGTTKFLLLENRTGQSRKLRLTLPEELSSEDGKLARRLTISEIVVLSRDGNRFVVHSSARVPFVDSIQHYAVYQVVYAPVRLSLPKWVVFPGQQTTLPIRVLNLMDEPVAITLQVDSVIASIKGKPVTLRLKPKEQRQLGLPVEIKSFADWGTKTVFVKGSWDEGQGTRKTAYWLRPLIVGRNADVRCLTTSVTSHTPTITIVNTLTTPFGDMTWWHPALDVPGETAKDIEVVLNVKANANLPENFPLPSSLRLRVGDLRDGERKQIRLPLLFAPSLVFHSASLTIRWRDSSGVHERSQPLSVTLLPKQLPKTHPDQIATIIVADAEVAQGIPMSVYLPKNVKGETFVVRLPDGTPLPTHVEKVKSLTEASPSQRLYFIVPPSKALLKVDIGTEGDERVLVRGFSYREIWANDVTIRWLPGEGRETVLRLPTPTVVAPFYRLKLHGQAFWQNLVSIFAGEQRLAELDIKIGWQTLTIMLPSSLWEHQENAEIRLVFHNAHIPAEKFQGSTDKRVCNFALSSLTIEPDFEGQPLLLALCRADKPQTSSIAVKVKDGSVQADNGVIEIEWSESAGGTLTKFRSKAIGRDYAAQSFGAGIGTFGRFDPQNPATTTDRFVVDDFIWQRNSKAKVRVVEQNPVWVTVEVMGQGTREKWQGFKATQRYRLFAGLPLVELSVAVEPRPASLASRPEELVVLEARFNTHCWAKSFPNFVGLGDKPPEVYGQHVVHFGWRIGNWVPPILCLFNPNDLTETLSLLIVENRSARQKPNLLKDAGGGVNWVRQGFWGERRGKPVTERRYATIELIAEPPKPVQLRLWLWLNEGHHRQAKWKQQKLLLPSSLCVVPLESQFRSVCKCNERR